MNFYPVPPTVTAEVYARLPDELYCHDDSEWRGGFAGGYNDIFIEGPTWDSKGNLYVTDIPHGRILSVDRGGNVAECIKYDGEPNGMAIRRDGKFVVADYKQVSLPDWVSGCTLC